MTASRISFSSACSPSGRALRHTPSRNVTAHALPFGFGRGKKVVDDEKEAMWKAQQEILAARRSGKTMEGVSERRARVAQAAKEKEEKRRADRAALARGERPADDDEPYEPYGKEDAGMQGGILIPLAPFGIPKFDNGERFDLKALYTDEGWVDESADPMKWAKGMFGKKGKGKGKGKDDAGSQNGTQSTRASGTGKAGPSASKAQAKAQPEAEPKKKRFPWSK